MNIQFPLNRFVYPVWLAVVLLLLLGFGEVKSYADETPISKTAFYVY